MASDLGNHESVNSTGYHRPVNKIWHLWGAVESLRVAGKRASSAQHTTSHYGSYVFITLKHGLWRASSAFAVARSYYVFLSPVALPFDSFHHLAVPIDDAKLTRTGLYSATQPPLGYPCWIVVAVLEWSTR